MANLEESPVWTPSVYQIETTDPVLGGPVQPEPATGGLANRQGLALANRTAYLRQALETTEQALSEQIDLKADIHSPALTGEPTAPTPAAADDSDRIATTAHVQAALLAQITASLARVRSIHNLPTSNIGPIIVAEASEVWIWVDTPHYTGYRSPLCGRTVYGHTVTPLANEIDAVGGLLSKTAYAGLWGYCRENGLVVSQSTWSANIGAHWFVDVSPTQFRVPDLRNQFLRFTGTDADTANARAMGSAQKDALQNITGSFHAISDHDSEFRVIRYPSGVFGSGGSGVPNSSINDISDTQKPTEKFLFNAANVARTSSETRSSNIAFHPRIHV